MLDNQNPILIQQGDGGVDEELIPLVLIHDGGGTVFSYFCLGSLGRKVYGLSNPRFHSGRPWKGGINQMCKLYVKLIQSVIPRGKILLGGWSFGGIISIELTKQLASTDIEVAGILMIDSICPLAFKDSPHLTCKPIPASTEHTRPETKLMVARCMKQAGDLLQTWTIPKFAPRRKIPIIESETTSSGHSSPYSTTISSPSSSSSTSSRRSSDTNTDYSSSSPSSATEPKPHNLDLDIVNLSLLPQLPPIAMLHCEDYVPTQGTGPAGEICKVDLARDQRCLGWEEYDSTMVSHVQNIPGHHFNIFDQDHVKRTTREIRHMCWWLESGSI